MTDGAHGAPEHSKPDGGHVVQSTSTRSNVTRRGMIFIRHAKDAISRGRGREGGREKKHLQMLPMALKPPNIESESKSESERERKEEEEEEEEEEG